MFSLNKNRGNRDHGPGRKCATMHLVLSLSPQICSEVPENAEGGLYVQGRRIICVYISRSITLYQNGG